MAYPFTRIVMHSKLKPLLLSLLWVIGVWGVSSLLSPLTLYADSAFNSTVVKFTCMDSEQVLVSRGAAVVGQGETRIYIGTHQVSSNNQNPIIVRFSNGVQEWCINEYETSGVDGRGNGLLWEGDILYAALSVDGGGTNNFAAEDGWLNSYGSGGGPKVGVIVKLDPATGQAQQGTYLSAQLGSGSTNSLTVQNFCLTTTDTLVVLSETAHWPRYANRNPMNDVMVSSPTGFSHWIEFSPDLTTAITAYGEDRADPANHAGTMPAQDCFSTPVPTRTPDPTLTERLYLPMVRRL
jgi:hypothetical protein